MKTTKPCSSRSRFTAAFVLVAALLIQFTPASASADNLYWSSNSIDLGGNGTWNTSNGRWGATVAGPFSTIWNNANNDTAIFSSRIGNTVTNSTSITNGGLQFNITGYTITNTSGSLLVFGAADNSITLNNIAAASIGGPVGGTGNVIFTQANPTRAGTLTLNGTSTGGWSGTTTINPSMTLALSQANQGLLNTTGINLNGGAITLTSADSDAEKVLNRLSDSAGITVNGGTITYTTAGTTRVFAETNGSVALTSGQLNIVESANRTGGSQTLTLSGLTRSGSAAVTFSAATTGPQIAGNRNMIVVTGGGTTAAGQIIGPWASGGTAANVQTDFAVYNADYVTNANIAPSAETAWTTLANAYTLSNAVLKATTLTASRDITALRAIAGASALTGVDIAGDAITNTAHGFNNGDVVNFGGTPPGGLATGTPYYIINKTTDTYQVAATSGGSAINLTSAGTSPNVTGGLALPSGVNLGTYGILAAGATFVIGGNGGVLTLPAAGAGQLHVTSGNATLVLGAPINDNGGALTLVKNGGGNLFFRSSSNNFSGGLVINAGGTVTYTADAQIGTNGSRNITFNGAATLTGFDGSSLGQLSVGSGGVATISGNNITFATTTGSGNINWTAASAKTLSLGDSSGFNGNVMGSWGNNGGTIQFSKMGDAVGCGSLQYGGGTGDGTQAGTFALAGNAGPLTLTNRQIAFLSKPFNWSIRDMILQNNNSTPANNLVIKTALANYSDRNHNFQLGGGNTGDNEFAGVIGDASLGYIYDGVFSSGNNVATNGVLSLVKADAGKWILSGTNTYTGITTVSGGTLAVKNLANGGSPSALGQSPAAAANLLLANGTTLQYTGPAASSDRSFTINGTSAGHGATLDASGTGAINFTSTATPGYGTAAQTRTLTLAGTNSQLNTLAATLTNNTSGALSLAKSGAGTWLLTGANLFTGNATINAGALEAIDGTGLPTASILQLRGGVLQGSGTFSRTIGTTAGLVGWSTSSGGFAARGGTYNIQLNGGTASVTWNNGSFVDANNTLIFGSSSADSMVDFQNALNLGSSSAGLRTITVNDNPDSSGDFARMSGVIANTAAGWGILKTGAGRLELANVNTYSGSNVVSAGTLALGINNALPTTSVTMGNATLDAATFTNNLGILRVTNTATINLGSGGALAFADSSAISWSGGTLTLTGTFVSGSSLRFGTTSSGLTATQLGLISRAGGGTFTNNSSGYLIYNVIAPNLAYTVGAGAGQRVLLSELITSNGIFSSQGSPTYTIASASATSAQGGTIAFNSTNMQYTAPNSSITNDTFTYTISDGVNTSAAATVTITFVQQSGGNASLTVSGSTASGTLFGIPGQNYGIERATNSASGPYYLLSSPPLTNAILPITAAGDGSVNFSDTNAPGSSAFYRLIQQ